MQVRSGGSRSGLICGFVDAVGMMLFLLMVVVTGIGDVVVNDLDFVVVNDLDVVEINDVHATDVAVDYDFAVVNYLDIVIVNNVDAIDVAVVTSCCVSILGSVCMSVCLYNNRMRG